MIATAVVKRVDPSPQTPRQVAAGFRELTDGGARIRPSGRARSNPPGLLSAGYTPRHSFRLFDATYYLTNMREDANFRFFVAYVHLGGRDVFPRIIYKDLSLVWRSASHYIRSEDENWIGKGDLKTGIENGVEMEYSAEETTNLPLEIQAALDAVSRRGGRVARDHRAVELVLREAPDDRFEPYGDFTGPRRRAMADLGNRINDGEYVACFERRNDPASLRFVPGFEPDFESGALEVSELRSRLYGGDVRKFRFLSKNRQIQYQFVAAPKHVWIIPPQALTTEIMSYGLRTVDVHVDDDLCVPGYEYHFIDDSLDPPQLHSQIPEGFAGEASEVDPARADASRWLDALPVVQEFRRRVPLPF